MAVAVIRMDILANRVTLITDVTLVSLKDADVRRAVVVLVAHMVALENSIMTRAMANVVTLSDVISKVSMDSSDMITVIVAMVIGVVAMIIVGIAAVAVVLAVHAAIVIFIVNVLARTQAVTLEPMIVRHVAIMIVDVVVVGRVTRQAMAAPYAPMCLACGKEIVGHRA